MSAAVPAASSPAPHRWLWPSLLVLAIFAVYANSLHGPFVYDDVPAIAGNPTIRQLWPLAKVLLPQAEGGLTVSGRPVLNLSFALNYAISGEAVWSYHLFNLLVHAGSALLLCGIVRRTLTRTGPADVAASADRIGVTIAALWALHPVQTQAVTYTVQRAESLMGFFYLLTLYAFVRAAECHPLCDTRIFAPGKGTDVCHLIDDEVVKRRRGGGWRMLAVVACALGMATKEVMATAPLLVLLYDRAFVAGNFLAAWRRRRGFYLGLAATWLLLAALVFSTGGNRGGTVGVGVGVPWWAYGLTQFQAVARYLALSFWPQPLVFEYGQFWVQRTGDFLPGALIVVPLVMGTGIALWRWPAAGFLGAWFFGILAPSSLTPGTIQMIVEHRVYLPLAAVVAATVLLLQRGLGRRACGALLVIALGLGGLTARRNQDYSSALAIWSDTVTKRPDNARAREAFADVLAQAGRIDEAIGQHREAVRLKPDEATFHYNLGVLLAQAGRFREAAESYAVAEKLQPAMPQFHYNHGIALVRSGRGAEAIAHYEMALRLRPDDADVHVNLASALATIGRFDEAIGHYRAVLPSRAADAGLRTDLAGALLLAGRPDEAIAEFRAALALQPEAIAARFGLANALVATRRFDEAEAAYTDVMRRAPDHADAHFKFGNLLMATDRVAAAAPHYEAAVRLNPGDAEAHHNLGVAYARLDRLAEARTEFEAAVRLKPDYAEARRHLEQVNTLLSR